MPTVIPPLTVLRSIARSVHLQVVLHPDVPRDMSAVTHQCALASNATSENYATTCFAQSVLSLLLKNLNWGLKVVFNPNTLCLDGSTISYYEVSVQKCYLGTVRLYEILYFIREKSGTGCELMQ